MANINFVPDDYIQKKESNRANWMYLFLCIVMLGALGGTFGILKARQSRIDKQAEEVAVKMAQAQKDIAQLEQLQIKRQQMMQTALTAVELLESVPRSIILATLTNNLPEGTSIVKADMSEKVSRELMAIRGGTYAKAGSSQGAGGDMKNNTFIEIEGIAPSDKEVADFIANLDSCSLFSGINLIYTKEFKKNKDDINSVRTFKISTMLGVDAVITKEFIDSVKANGV